MNKKLKKVLKALIPPIGIIGVVLVFLLLNQNLLDFINKEAATILQIRQGGDQQDDSYQ